MYVYRIRSFLGSYLLQLGGRLDAIIFTAGVGENSSLIRAKVLSDLSHFGIVLDEEANNACVGPACARDGVDVVRISSSTVASPAVLVVNTNEELEIALQVCSIIDKNELAVSKL